MQPSPSSISLFAVTGNPPNHEPGYYPPPSSPPYSPPPKKKSKAPWIVLGIALGILVLVIGGCVVGAILLFQNDDFQETFSDLAIDFSDGVAPTGPVSCEVVGIDYADDYEVVVTATNASGEPSAYRIDYELVGQGGQSFGTDYGVIARVDPGETVDDDVFSILDGDAPWTEVDCVVTDALRVRAD
jgi:hypothetical protein